METPLGHHLRLRLRNDRVLTPNRAHRLAGARVVIRQSHSTPIIAFRFADTHLHVETLASRPATEELARRLAIGLQRAIGYGCAFSFPRLKPLHDQYHLQNTFRYILGQAERHELHNDPLGEASNLPDLLGMRLMGAHISPLVHDYLPRVKQAEMLRFLHLDQMPSSWTDVTLLAEAALAAAGLSDLHVNTAEAVGARTAAVHVAHGRIPDHRIAELLRVDSRTVHRLKQRRASTELVAAIHRQIAVREAIAATNSHHAPVEHG